MKILGSLFILIASISSCVVYERSEKSKISSTKEICELIRYIKSQIEYFSTPISKIFASYAEKSPLLSELCEKRLDLAKKSLDKDDFKTVSEFFTTLGKGLRDEELALCSYTLETLENSIAKKEKDYPDKIKVFRAMALFFGFCVVILLI